MTSYNKINKRTTIIIGSGFAGLSAASFLAKAGEKVIVLEKNEMPGGRAKQLKQDGFTFDMGPSWYWMPDVFERYFQQFGKNISDCYKLLRLNPSYRVYWNNSFTDMPADLMQVRELFESIEPGSAIQLDHYLGEAAYKYQTGINNLVHKPGLSVTEFFDWQIVKGLFRLDVFTSIQKHIQKHFKSEQLRRLMEFPVLFLGALPENTPALYSLINYADIQGGTWYPQGGMYAVVSAMYKLATELGVEFRFMEPVQQIRVNNGKADGVITSTNNYFADAIISTADYYFTEQFLLPAAYRSYSTSYWSKKIMAPSCLLYYVGLNKKLINIQHHSLFFDASFSQHGYEIYTKPQWPSYPLFYASINSHSDAAAAPPGCEAMVFLIPIAAGLTGDTDELREKYFDLIIKRMEKHIGQNISEHIVFKKSFSIKDFSNEYNSFKGNAYGLANTLSQTAIFRPSCKSRKVKNLFFAGQLTVPGPGVPPALISGEVVANEVIRSFR